MSEVRCPSCGVKREVRGTEEFFEIRGQHPRSRMPVRKCRNCGAGFEIRFIVPFVWPRAKAIPPDFWRRMERAWKRFVDPTAAVSPGPLAKLAAAEEEVRRRQEED